MKSIYDYLDYREFLRDRMEALKAEDAKYTYRYFNTRSGFKSSAHLKLILDVERNLSKKTVLKVSNGFNLTEKESLFFEALVNFNQARTSDEKDHYYNQLVKRYPPKKAQNLELKYYRIFSHWYYVAILELIRVDNFRACPKWISSRLKPRVSIGEVEKALEDLLEVGLLKRTEEGGLMRQDEMLRTPDLVKNGNLMRFHEQMIKLSLRALKYKSTDKKEYATLTIALSNTKMAKLKKKFQEFKKEIHSFLESEDGSEKTDVIHVNLQFFNLTG